MDGEKTLSESKSPADIHKFWDKEVKAAEKRLKDFMKRGNDVVDRYEDQRSAMQSGDSNAQAATRLNLFYTNITTMKAMMYGNQPKIDVAREHNDPDDDDARVASLMLERILTADVRTSGDDLATALRNCLQDRLLPGLGQARVVFDYKNDAESAKIVYTHWQDFMWGWCRTWSECPWVAFRAYLTKEQVEERFNEKAAITMKFNKRDVDEDADTSPDEAKSVVEKAEVWEIWCKKSKRVYFYNKEVDLILDVREDPLKIRSFWPCPMPMAANTTTRLFQPTADFILAQDLYNQIDRLATRVTVITRAVKVVGVYDQAADGVKRMLQEGSENDLIPVSSWAMFAEKGGLNGAVDWFPVQEVVGVLSTLRQVLSESIDLLYQVTGMSDILRGASTEQYTSDGTQQLKAKFGSIRVQAMQDEFARFAADLAEIKAEIVCKHFGSEAIMQQSGAEFLPKDDKPRIGAAMDLMRRPDFVWRVDIKPESMSMVDYAQLKSERTEFLNAMATYIQSAQAAVQSIPGSLPVMLEMLKWGMAGFKGSDYLEGMMDKAIEVATQAAEQPQDDPEAKARQAEMQRDQQAHQMEMQKLQAKAQADIAVEREKAKNAMQQELLDHRHKMEQELVEHKNEITKLREEFMADMKLIKENLMADLTTERAQSAYAMEEGTQEHQYTMREMGASHAVAMEEKNEDAKMAARQQNGETDSN